LISNDIETFIAISCILCIKKIHGSTLNVGIFRFSLRNIETSYRLYLRSFYMLYNGKNCLNSDSITVWFTRNCQTIYIHSRRETGRPVDLIYNSFYISCMMQHYFGFSIYTRWYRKDGAITTLLKAFSNPSRFS